MSSPSKQDADLAAVQTEVHQMNEETQDAGLISSSFTAETDIDGLSCLSGDKPFFDVFLSKSHVESPYQLVVPVHMAPEFPRVAVPTVISHGGKKWTLLYHGESKRRHFEFSDWKRFAADNNLKMGDACIFEVLESSDVSVRLRVVILRNTSYLPPELDSIGETPEKAIQLD